MFLHIGAEKEVEVNKILFILDYDCMKGSLVNQEFIMNMEKMGIIKDISEDKPKSIVIMQDKKDITIYFSPITSLTLQKRMFLIEEMSNKSFDL